MSYTWSQLDDLLKWRAKKGLVLSPKTVLSERGWLVQAKRGIRRKGNQDLVVVVMRPNGQTEERASFKDLVGDIDAKATMDRDWMKHAFMPSLVHAAVFGEDPVVELGTQAVPSRKLSGYPPNVLLAAIQVICLSERRKYPKKEPFGGRFLPVRLAAGIVWGVWSPIEIEYGAYEQNTVAVLRALTGVREPSLGLVLAAAQSWGPRAVSREQLRALAL